MAVLLGVTMGHLEGEYTRAQCCFYILILPPDHTFRCSYFIYCKRMRLPGPPKGVVVDMASGSHLRADPVFAGGLQGVGLEQALSDDSHCTSDCERQVGSRWMCLHLILISARSLFYFVA